jgi:hypothetical protein
MRLGITDSWLPPIIQGADRNNDQLIQGAKRNSQPARKSRTIVGSLNHGGRKIGAFPPIANCFAYFAEFTSPPVKPINNPEPSPAMLVAPTIEGRDMGV